MNFSLNKKLILLVIAGFSFAAASAQVQFGVKAGANFATLSGSDAQGSSTLVGLNIGALVKIPVNDAFSVQPEVVYSMQGAKSDQGGGSSGTLAINYINVPILATYTLPAGIFFQAGPQIGFLASAKAKAGGVSADAKTYFKSTDFSLAFGAGYLTSMNLGFNVRYNLGLSNIENTTNTGGTGDWKNGVIQVGVFYMFGDSGAKK